MEIFETFHGELIFACPICWK